MRPTLAVIALLLAPIAAAEGDARMAFLTKQLSGAKDPRARAQTALLLGASKNPAAVGPLCAALKDSDALVRNAVARALGDLKDPQGGPCLKAAKGDSDTHVQAAIEKALEALAAPAGPAAGALYVAIEPIVDKSGGGADTIKLADTLLRAQLTKMGASFAPPGEDKSAALSLIRSRKLKGWQLRLQVLPHDKGGIKVSLLCMTYPDQSLKGDYSVKASGAKPPELLKLMVPKVVDDAADDLEWSKR
ncbi:MAG: HEAT repeat domain-containing protein [Myxococcaceae bacterium]